MGIIGSMVGVGQQRRKAAVSGLGFEVLCKRCELGGGGCYASAGADEVIIGIAM